MQTIKQMFSRNLLAARLTTFNPLQRMVFSSV